MNNYQDYVIKDGKYIGEFEKMYFEIDDPWLQSQRCLDTTRSVALNWLSNLKVSRVIEFGSGLGFFTSQISKLGFNVLGLDISNTAVQKAKESFPEIDFRVGSVTDYNLIRDFQPEVFIFPEVTWYILDQLSDLLIFLKTEFPDAYVIHFLTTYRQGVQQYGNHFFTDNNGIMKYFDVNVIEYGQLSITGKSEISTFFFGKIK